MSVLRTVHMEMLHIAAVSGWGLLREEGEQIPAEHNADLGHASHAIQAMQAKDAQDGRALGRSFGDCEASHLSSEVWTGVKSEGS